MNLPVRIVLHSASIAVLSWLAELSPETKVRAHGAAVQGSWGPAPLLEPLSLDEDSSPPPAALAWPALDVDAPPLPAALAAASLSTSTLLQALAGSSRTRSAEAHVAALRCGWMLWVVIVARLIPMRLALAARAPA
jgi:hypothetical protein